MRYPREEFAGLLDYRLTRLMEGPLRGVASWLVDRMSRSTRPARRSAAAWIISEATAPHGKLLRRELALLEDPVARVRGAAILGVERHLELHPLEVLMHARDILLRLDPLEFARSFSGYIGVLAELTEGIKVAGGEPDLLSPVAIMRSPQIDRGAVSLALCEHVARTYLSVSAEREANPLYEDVIFTPEDHQRVRIVVSIDVDGFLTCRVNGYDVFHRDARDSEDAASLLIDVVDEYAQQGLLRIRQDWRWGRLSPYAVGSPSSTEVRTVTGKRSRAKIIARPWEPAAQSTPHAEGSQ